MRPRLLLTCGGSLHRVSRNLSFPSSSTGEASRTKHHKVKQDLVIHAAYEDASSGALDQYPY